MKNFNPEDTSKRRFTGTEHEGKFPCFTLFSLWTPRTLALPYRGQTPAKTAVGAVFR
jgi:hypothetical protein